MVDQVDDYKPIVDAADGARRKARFMEAFPVEPGGLIERGYAEARRRELEAALEAAAATTPEFFLIELH
jgi:hypothetical protein